MKIGFIGMGNMAGAMLKGILEANATESKDVICSNRSEEHRQKAEQTYHVRTTDDNAKVAKESEIIFLAVKPQQYETVIREIKDVVSEEQLIITIAPGKTLKWLKEQFGRELPIIRTMPNTPAMVGEGMTAVCPSPAVSETQLDQAMMLFNTFGKAEIVTESMIDAVVAVSGSSPAYVYMMIEAMADAAVLGGMPRAKAYAFAAQAVLGSAKMVLETGMHPGALKDMVCSPGGTTIEAVRVLEQRNFRSALIEAMTACTDKSKNM